MRYFAALLAATSLFAQQPSPTISDLKTLLARHPEPKAEVQLRLQLLRAYEMRSDWVPAAAQLERLRTLAPDDPEYAYQLGSIYQRISKAAFQRMRALAPQGARVQQLFGEQYTVTGDNAKAIHAYQAAIAAEPKLEGSHAALAMIFLQLGKFPEAQGESDRELALDPESAMAKQVAQAIAHAVQEQPQ